VVTLNFSDEPTAVTLTAPHHRIALSTDRSRDGSSVGGTVTLGPWQGMVLLEDG
jgi:hypothetical protein